MRFCKRFSSPDSANISGRMNLHDINIFRGKNAKHIPAVVNLLAYQVTTGKLSINV